MGREAGIIEETWRDIETEWKRQGNNERWTIKRIQKVKRKTNLKDKKRE